MSVDFRFIAKNEIASIIPFLNMLDKTIVDEVLKQRLDEMLAQGYKCIGMYEDNDLIGVCGIWILTKYYIGKHIEPDNVIIAPEYRNRNIGARLMEWIEAYAKANGCVAGELNCYVGNEKAQKFWEKEGYEVIGLHYQKKFANA